MKARTDPPTASQERKGRRKWYSTLVTVCLAFLINGCGDEITNPNRDPLFEPPEESVQGSGAAAAGKFLLRGIGKGAATTGTGFGHGVGDAVFGWTMGALGLADEGPDYTQQLDKIDEDLQVVIDELSGIKDELVTIEGELTVLNCTNWSTTLTTEKARVDNLLSDYQSFASTAASGGTVSGTIIADWVDQVEAQGSYASHESMGDIIATFISALTGPANTGVIPACVQSITKPADETMSVDDDYYAKVQLFTDYYYNYQVRALFLYVEAKHYRAWSAAGKPTSLTLDADSIANVCSNASAALYCNQAAGRTNEVYNALVAQATTGGAPYTSSNFVLKYDTEFPYLVPLSLEKFTLEMDGNYCSFPLTSAAPCGSMANVNGSWADAAHVTYGGYTNWTAAPSGMLGHMLDGWTSGTAGAFLEQQYGFENMENKIIVSKATMKINLTYADQQLTVVPFFDTDRDIAPFSPFNTSSEFEELVNRTKNQGGLCTYFSTYVSHDWTEATDLPDDADTHPDRRNSFYDMAAHSRTCEGDYTTAFSFSKWPGWVISYDGTANPNDNINQYHWPLINVSEVSCTQGRSIKNVAGVWSMCGNDFTVWLDDYAPRPESCDVVASGVTCVLDATTIANARSKTAI